MNYSYDPEHLGEDVKALLAGATSALIVAPFITKSGILPLIGALAPGGVLSVVTRWEPREVRAGASDPMVIDDVHSTGGTVRLLPRLHAKVYLVGEQALVGSANTTGSALGFVRPANIEMLVAVPAKEQAVTRLLAVVDALASPASRDYAVQLVEYAATLPSDVPLGFPEPGGDPSWIPQSRVPSRVEACYFGDDDRDDYRADLEAINAPPGLSLEDFRTHVGLVLQQGLVGKIYWTCEGLQQWAGVQQMREIFAHAGVEVGEEAALHTWSRLLNWFRYYLGANDSLNGGYSVRRGFSAT